MSAPQRNAGRALSAASALILALVLAAPPANAAAPVAAAASVSAPASLSTGVPTGLTGTTKSTTSILLSWDAYADAPRYRVQLSTSQDMSNSTYYRFYGTSVEIKDLQPGLTYYARVRAITADGTSNLSGYSPIVAVATQAEAGAPLAVPTGLKMAASGTSLTVSWNQVPGAPRYRVQLSANADMSGASYYRFTATTAEIKGLRPGTAYYARVRVIDDLGASLTGYSGSATATTGYDVPTGLRATGQTGESISLAWNPSAGVPQYRIQVYANADMSDSRFYRFTGTSAEVKGLALGTKYNVRIRAITAEGVSLTSYSAPITATTAATPAYAVPSGLKVTGGDHDTLNFAWNPVPNAPRYRVQLSTSPDMSNSLYYRFTDPSASINGLQAGTTYYAKIRVITWEGETLTGYSAAVSGTTAATAAFSAPTGVKATAVDHDTLNISWTPVPNAPRYRVQLSTSPDMSNSTYHRFYESSVDINGLRPETTYYAKVRVITDDGATLTGYSSSVSATTTTEQYPAPTGFAATSASHLSVNLAWNAVPNAPQYRVAVADNPDMVGAEFHRITGTSFERRGLKAGTNYYFKLRVITMDGISLSPYTPALGVDTKTAPASLPAIEKPLSAASYNIMCANCVGDDDDPGLSWPERADGVIRTITSRMPDIVGIQEASQGWLAGVDRAGGLSQFEDLVERLSAAGAPYALANNKRNNCVNHVTPTNCVYQDQGASQGTRIIYNPAAVDILRSGSYALPRIDPTENQRYFAWAVARQKTTGKLFFFGDTHLSTSKADGYYELRRQQAETIMNVIRTQNTDKLPVLLVGDMNSSKWIEPSNAPYDVFTAGGLVDPLGNTYMTELPSSLATAERRINPNINSWNGFERTARATDTVDAYGNPGNGTYIDYIFTSPMRVGVWETVANVDSAGNYVGLIPSDHNMLFVKVGLP